MSLPINTKKIVIFTDLDGSLLNRENFEFLNIKNYIKKLLSNGIFIIPNSSKTKFEIKNFNDELGEKLPYIVENGAAIYNLNFLNSNFPEKISLSREKDEILKIFVNEIPSELISKCKFVEKLSEETQSKIFGLHKVKLKNALKREYTIPFLFEGDKSEKSRLTKIVEESGLTIQEGGRVINLCDNTSKASAMKNVIKIIKKIVKEKIIIVGVGDNFNDLEMLKNSDIPCLVFNDKFTLDTINIKNCLVSKKPAPEGWAEVVKMALDKVI